MCNLTFDVISCCVTLFEAAIR